MEKNYSTLHAPITYKIFINTLDTKCFHTSFVLKVFFLYFLFCFVFFSFFSEMCKCTVSGDPHFHTFDGEILHLMGDCKYVLSESIKFNDSCNFRVDVQNERRGSNQRVSWPKFVNLHIYGQSIRLGPNENVFVSHKILADKNLLIF